jgi:hypothetical protein
MVQSVCVYAYICVCMYACMCVCMCNSIAECVACAYACVCFGRGFSVYSHRRVCVYDCAFKLLVDHVIV